MSLPVLHRIGTSLRSDNNKAKPQCLPELHLALEYIYLERQVKTVLEMVIL